MSVVTIRRLLPCNAVTLYALIAANRAHLSNMVWAGTATLDSTRDHLVKTEDLMYGVYARGLLCGVVSLRPIGPESYMLGYWIAQAHQGQGIITAACRLMFDAYFVGDARLQRVVAITKPTNLASQRVLGKLGFVRCGEVLEGWFNYIKEFGDA